MAENILNNFQVHSRLTESRGKGVSENVATKIRKKRRTLLDVVLKKHLVIAVPG